VYYLPKICPLFLVKSAKKVSIRNRIGSKGDTENTVLVSVSLRLREKGISLGVTGVVKQFGGSHMT